jgi:hypothetical protein
MILFDLRCAKDHVFEAWFRNSATFEAQSEAGEIACPACGSRRVEKAPMAPRIGKANAEESRGSVSKELADMRRQLQELRAKVEANCDYVGDRFAEEARRIHHGEIDKRSIYGEASSDEARELEEEGVEFARVPWLPRHDS